MLGFVVKLTDAPERVGPYDLASLQKLGVTERAIIDATYICVGFNIINRIADAMNFKLPPEGRPEKHTSAAPRSGRPMQVR